MGVWFTKLVGAFSSSKPLCEIEDSKVEVECCVEYAPSSSSSSRSGSRLMNAPDEKEDGDGGLGGGKV